MTQHVNARERHRSAKAVAAPTHAFEEGVHVSYRSSGPSAESYRVTRRLPDGGHGLQYRIRSDRDGQERVVIESALQRTKGAFR
ncbi:hypothetical protein MCBRY_002984 [Methylocystis bryophila]|uniref:Uncharacterized protein n=1 Tax=Methylocystis bryophila TaxID=655015 RepID=A0A1W6MWZ4_9HYPH|nr:hypothetical protein B1812_14550 [Methylocystis bryophila]